jgi:predicted nucleotidyltransferase
MLINKFLEDLFRSPSNISVLRALNDRVIGISGRETARLTNLTHRSALKALTALEELGVVTRITTGRTHLFTLDRQKYLSKQIIQNVFNIEKKLNSDVISSITKCLLKLTESVILYGSVARKEESISSDYDLCIVYTKNINKIESAVSDLRDKLNEQYSIQLAPLYISVSEFKKRAQRNLSPVNSIVKDGIKLCGRSINDLIK